MIKVSSFKKIIISCILILLLAMTNIPVSAKSTYNQQLISANSNRENGINNFPESYKTLLEKLVNKKGHNNWKFIAFYTDIDWNELVSEETEHLKNTIIKNENNMYPNSWYCSCNKQGDDEYFCASEDIIKYYLDPRNLLTEINC